MIKSFGVLPVWPSLLPVVFSLLVMMTITAMSGTLSLMARAKSTNYLVMKIVYHVWVSITRARLFVQDHGILSSRYVCMSRKLGSPLAMHICIRPIVVSSSLTCLLVYFTDMGIIVHKLIDKEACIIVFREGEESKLMSTQRKAIQ